MPRSRSLAELIQQNRSSQTLTNPSIAANGPGFATSQAQGSGSQTSSGGGGSSAGLAALSGAVKGATAGTGAAAGAAESLGIGSLLSLFCWVAAEYYPRNSDDWYRCRNWVLTHGFIFDIYCVYGERFAGFLHRHPLARWLFTPVVRWAHKRGTL